MDGRGVNGTTVNGHHASSLNHGFERFSHIPRAIDIPVSGGELEEAVEVDLEELLDDPTELCTLLENENVGKNYWTTIALAYVKQRKVDLAVDIINRGLGALNRGKADEKLGLYNCLCWMHLLRSRNAPRVNFEGKPDSEVKTKEVYLRAATATLNDASRISPSYPPLFLARGVLCLLRASLLQDQSEKTDLLRQAIKSFDDALKGSRMKNMMAILGRSRAQFSLKRWADALTGYQQVLERAPHLTNPDPRIGIGCCLWQLDHKEDAQIAWQRALEINPESKIANVLLGLYHLNRSFQYPITDPQFKTSYTKAMVDYTQKAFKLDNDLPLACSTFGNYFLIRHVPATVDKLARKAIELTDINAIASDGWYLLAKKEHQSPDLARASDFYTRADQARGGDDSGYIPAKFGAAQVKVLQQDLDGAKFRLEKLVALPGGKIVEALILLGSLVAEEAFSSAATLTPEERAEVVRKATGYLEAVRVAWKDPKKNFEPDSAVLLNLARLYEVENPERSLQCLQEVERLELDDLPEEVTPENTDDETVITAYRREHLSPALLNNIACFHYHADRLTPARDTFQSALNACVRLGERDPTADTDALVTTISFNLARTFEAENQIDEARKIYEGLLTRHSDYIDAKMRLTYIALRQNPNDEGPKSMAQLYETESTDMEVRSLFGWYLRKAKRKTANIAEDQEQRHFKHTLQGHDKHDRYSLTAMGNIYLATAREMRRDTEVEKDRRRKMYERAVEFFDKALQLDPRNAYAAQGIGIAIVEEKKDLATALQIFTKVKETIKEASVFVNLGHVYCELKQFSRGIENYEAALAKDRQRDPQILACLGRAWLLRGKLERSVQAMKTSLDYSERALQVAPDQIHFKFNVAFVQIQIAQLLYTLPEMQRTLEEVEHAAQGLDDAIESFSAIAKSPNPPFPRHDIEQRANMGRNTMRKQLERALQSQREYENKNAARLEHARQLRDADLEKRAAEKRRAEEAAQEQRRLIAEERQKMQERDRQLAEIRAEEERKKQDDDKDELSVDEATGERKKKAKRVSSKRKKRGEEADDDTDGEVPRTASRSRTPVEAAERSRRKKKRKLERRTPKENSKYKSSERVVDSDLEDELTPMDETNGVASSERNGNDDEDEVLADLDDDIVAAPRRKIHRVVDEDDSEDGDVGDEGGTQMVPIVNGEDPDEDD